MGFIPFHSHGWLYWGWSNSKYNVEMAQSMGSPANILQEVGFFSRSEAVLCSVLEMALTILVGVNGSLLL